MSDRELLELAAKAAGYLFIEGNPKKPVAGLMMINWSVWNPITDDGDALRLAVKLGISIDMEDQSAWRRNGNRLIQEYWGGDYDPCYRLAIVRAAAEIGRSVHP